MPTHGCPLPLLTSCIGGGVDGPRMYALAIVPLVPFPFAVAAVSRVTVVCAAVIVANSARTLRSRNYCGHDRVKHLDLRDMLVREHHQRGLAELVSVPTRFQLADPLTKTLAGPAVRTFRAWALRGQLPPDCPAV